MWQGHLIRQTPGNASPRHPPPPRRVDPPTPDGFECFLQACIGLSRVEGTPPVGVVCGPRLARRQAHRLSHFDRGRVVPLARSQSSTSTAPQMAEACGLTRAMW
jgi:hypothetical protein